ncbi:Ca2+-binding RTX toxin-like protein [Microvirga lupini]|uniref:Ca2+-binding RTX toxin-like protein n=1 Tax=Microvirga lupini TaxID=420324 RepID=A0A7W4YZ08_9HYPH|nr:calcium-binding protein [Microvirga lupini]MBB3020573.1 Ca2+-binding RTX toxin-like protein [Microvirga lupini]
MGTSAFWGADIYVNGLGDNDEPHITALADGRFVVAWVDNDAQEVRAQILNADGSLRGSQFTLNTTSVGEQQFPNITALADGRFVAVWTDQRAYLDNSENADIWGQLFSVDGNKIGTEFQVNDGISIPSAHALVQPGITTLSDGGFAITWRDHQPPENEDYVEMWLARYDSNGVRVGPVASLGQTQAYQTAKPVIQGLDDGSSVILWTEGTVTNAVKLAGRIIDADGSKIVDLIIGDIRPDSENTVQIDPQIAKLEDGGFVVTWKLDEGSTPVHEYGIWARVFNSDGSQRTTAFEITPPAGVEIDPVVTALKDGRFMVTWADFGQLDNGAPGYKVKSQAYKADGTADGSAITIHAPDGWNNGRMPSITTLEDGRVAVSWWHDGEPTIRVKIIDPREAGIELSSRTLTAQKLALSNDWIGTGFGDVFDAGGGNDLIEGGGGADGIAGGDGFDTVTFAHAASGVVASMQGGTGGDAAGDVYSSIERLIGSRHNDTFYGNGSAVLQGSGGNDTYHVIGRDQVVETAGGGYDKVVVTGTSYQLDVGAEVEEVLFANVSSRKSYSLTGSSAANTLKGNVGKDTLKGLDGNDKLYGGSGDDKLHGGSGNDLLSGSKGKDSFVFDTKLGTSTTDRKVNFDTIADFSAKDDTIRLENKIFTKLKKTGTLKKDFFATGTKASDKNDYVVYNKKTGVLSYDADGSGKGKAIEFAQVKKGLALSHLDIFVI